MELTQHREDVTNIQLKANSMSGLENVPYKASPEPCPQVQNLSWDKEVNHL